MSRLFRKIAQWMTSLGDMIRGRDLEGNGSPESVVVAKIGTTYHRRDGGAGTSFYVKESGNGLSTGWAAK